MSISENRIKLHRAQAALGKMVRLAANALKEQGLSNSEIAEKLDISESMVRSVLDRGKPKVSDSDISSRQIPSIK